MGCSGCCATRAGIPGGRDDVRDYVMEHLGSPGVLIADETGFIKKGTRPPANTRALPGGRRTARPGCSLPTPRPAGTR